MCKTEDNDALDSLASKRVMMHFCAPATNAESEIDRKLTGSAEQYDIPFEGQTLKVYGWGEGKTILLVHGWGSQASHMAFLGKNIAKSGFRVIAFDGPAHGKSEFNGSHPRSSMPEFSRAIFHLSNHFGPIYGMVGHSFGGAVATFTACGQANLSGYQVEVEKLVLISAPSGIEAMVNHYCRNYALPDGSKSAVIEQLEREFPLKVGDYEINDALNKFAGEVLVVHDVGDPEVFIEEARQMVEGHRRVSLVETRGEGHRKILASRSLIKIVRSFL
ncbi:MAG: alpha/beta fold hydrolase [Desulfofustis sp.]|nr:alpha/beta fold hydrolase [Desulfofustis sp.]NNF46242.1 alpha/beta fold hydrolase [Desulfofustis sp.]NNK57393.1 alpha/beta fold hydrolase [Desulfofustis sp.]RZW25378.1 MAG: alpha/beta hydrolase [Desulfobulbaceae bacterium]